MSSLRIYFSSMWRDSASPCPWALCDDSGAVIDSGNSPLAALPKNNQCVAIVSADRVLHIRTKVPAGSRRRWQGALPFIAEEHTLPDPEENHVVPGQTHQDQLALSIIDKPWLKRVIEACTSAKLTLRRMVAETCLPAIQPQSWTIVWQGNSGFVRTGPDSGFALDDADNTTMPLALRLQLQHNTPERIVIHSTETPQWSELPVPIEQAASWDWRRSSIPAEIPNLLWGEFAPRARLGEWWPKVRPLAWLLLLALGVEILGMNAFWIKQAYEKNQINANMQRSFKQAFGNVTIVNAPLQMQRNLTELRHRTGQPDPNDFFALLDAFTHYHSQLSNTTVSGLSYDTNKLEISLRTTDRASLQQLQDKLQSQGFKVQAGSINQTPDSLEARLSIQAMP